MQAQEEAERVAYQNVLAEAERHADELYGEADAPEMPGICHTCEFFVPLGPDDQAEILRCIPSDVEGRWRLATHLRLCLGVCRKAVAEPERWMGVLYARDNPCDEWEERE